MSLDLIQSVVPPSDSPPWLLLFCKQQEDHLRLTVHADVKMSHKTRVKYHDICIHCKPKQTRFQFSREPLRRRSLQVRCPALCVGAIRRATVALLRENVDSSWVTHRFCEQDGRLRSPHAGPSEGSHGAVSWRVSCGTPSLDACREPFFFHSCHFPDFALVLSQVDCQGSG